VHFTISSFTEKLGILPSSCLRPLDLSHLCTKQSQSRQLTSASPDIGTPQPRERNLTSLNSEEVKIVPSVGLATSADDLTETSNSRSHDFNPLPHDLNPQTQAVTSQTQEVNSQPSDLNSQTPDLTSPLQDLNLSGDSEPDTSDTDYELYITNAEKKTKKTLKPPPTPPDLSPVLPHPIPTPLPPPHPSSSKDNTEVCLSGM